MKVPKKIIYFCLPFTGKHSLQIRTQINHICNADLPHFDTRFVFRSSSRISSFFRLRIKFPGTSEVYTGCVVYLFTCRCCSAWPRRMWAMFYTLEYHSTWVSLLSREDVLPTPLCPVYFFNCVLLVPKWTLAISKSFLSIPTRMSSWYTRASL